MKLVLKFEVSAAVVEGRNKFEFFISFAKMEFSPVLLLSFWCIENNQGFWVVKG